ncbi:hypothetical protein [Rasiella sp. SM2506]|uniref:hypothetical protein n=1 Tax=Rasiella sp. SM2506 TaxID=3423914 RepID=UPI003D7B9442
MKNLLFSSLIVLTISFTTQANIVNVNTSIVEEVGATNCHDIAINLANIELANGTITHAEWFGRVLHFLNICTMIED